MPRGFAVFLVSVWGAACGRWGWMSQALDFGFVHGDMDHNQVTLGEAIHQLLEAFDLAEGYAEWQALSEWRRILPEALQRRITALSIQSGVLSIRTDSAVLRNELDMKKSKIKERLNQAAGRAVIRVVRVG